MKALKLARGYKKGGRFSSCESGRCEACRGDGYSKNRNAFST